MTLLAGAASCDDKAASAPAMPSGRANQVAAKKTAEPDPPGARPAPLPKPRREPRKLCAGQTARDAPGEIDVARSVDGADPRPLRYGGRWVWVNVWAAWCKPCKEEMPILLSWRSKLEQDENVKVELAFVSIDDDEREMRRFLDSQPKTGVRASYWIEQEDARESWFSSIGFDEAPQLPVHALVDPAGKLACVIEGAVEQDDYPAVVSFLKR